MIQVLIDAANTDRYITKRHASNLVLDLAGAFDRDSTICLHLANDVLYPILVLATLASKCRWTGTNPAYTASELSHHFHISECKYVITETKDVDTVQKAVDMSGVDLEIIVFEDLLAIEVHSAGHFHTMPPSATQLNGLHRHKCKRSLRQLLSNHTAFNLETVTRGISLSDTAALMQTSGTTGLPKLAARSHHSMISEQQAIEDNNSSKPYEVRRLYCTPIFHSFAAPEMIFNALRLGQTSYFMRRFDDTFAQKIHDLGITETFGAPPMFAHLIAQPNARMLLQGLKAIYFGGAPLAPELRRQMLNLFEGESKPRIVPVYGMTEGGWFTTLKHDQVDDTGSLGKPIPGYELKLSPCPKTNIMDAQLVGEILIRGPQLMTGYHSDSQATAAMFEGDWLKTGDVGYFRDGKIYLVDRAKDLIKVNGWQVSPAELEDVLLQHPDVRDAAIVGVGEGVDEHPAACVVAGRADLTEETVRVHLRARLASYKISRTEVRFVKAIPKNAAGKILRNCLRGVVTTAVET